LYDYHAGMILIYEPMWMGTYHAPGNSVTIQTVARAFPEQRIRVLAEATHLAELRADPALAAPGNVTLRDSDVTPLFSGKTQIVSFARFRQEFGVLRAALRSVPRAEPCLIFLLSATPTAIFAASLLARDPRRRIRVQVGLHGNLNEITGWRSRNPLWRGFDLTAALHARHGARVRFLVLEDCIRDALVRLMPETRPVTDVLPLPVNLAEVPLAQQVPFALPLRVGLLGQATEAKGVTPFLALAHDIRAMHPGKVEFHHVGHIMPGDDVTRFAELAEPSRGDRLSRDAFRRGLQCLHFVCLPLQPGYYDLSASGTVIDAITWLKPLIATPMPLVAALFARFGDIGHLCDDPAAMRAAVSGLVEQPDPARYDRQVAAMRMLRDSRMPDRLAAVYRGIVTAGFGDLFEPNSGH
jgi:hypothetical protein